MRTTHNLVFAAVMFIAIGFWTVASFRADAGAPVVTNAQQTIVYIGDLPVQSFDAI